MVRKTKKHALQTRHHILEAALRLFSEQGVSSTTLSDIAHAAGVTRGAVYWHFKNKSDVFGEIWALSVPGISELEARYRKELPADPLTVLRKVLVSILESTATEERRRRMMEIIYHKCELAGELETVHRAQQSLCIQGYEHIEKTLRECINASLLPAGLQTRRAAILIRSYVSGIMENWLLYPQAFSLNKEARDYVSIILEMLNYCPTLGATPDILRVTKAGAHD